MKEYPNVHLLDHPLIRHKVAHLRDVKTNTKDFREIITEVATLMAYESFKDVPIEKVKVQTPFEVIEQDVVKNDSVAIVPILRAGLGMVDGVFQLFPTAKVGHIGLYRNEETLEPVEYYCKLPEDSDKRMLLILDPMLATGGSASAAINFIKQRGCHHMRLVNLIAAPEGIERIQKEHPDVDIYVAALDDHLNEHGYIVPGLGDAGDRIFGTK